MSTRSLTSVVNVRRAGADEWDVYIGRAVPRAKDKRCRVASVFANPFKRGEAANLTAEEACDAFEGLMRLRLQSGGRVRPWAGPAMPAVWWRAQLLKLRGSRLACWCHPDPCHGHVLVELIDELEAVQTSAGTAPA